MTDESTLRTTGRSIYWCHQLECHTYIWRHMAVITENGYGNIGGDLNLAIGGRGRNRHINIRQNS